MTAALFLHREELSGDQPGQVTARRRRRHAGEVRQLLAGERAAAEERGENPRPRRLAEESGHFRQHVGVTHVHTLGLGTGKGQGETVRSASKRSGWTRARS